MYSESEIQIVEDIDGERFGARYVAKLVSPGGMVLRETYPSNDMAVILARVERWS